MGVIKSLLEKPSSLTTASRYTALNGILYMASGCLLVVWPGAVQTLFLEEPFVGHEAGLIRVVGLTLGLIGWFYFFGGRSGAAQIVAASIVDRLIFVPAVFVPLAITGVFPHLMIIFAILDPLLAIGAWVLFRREG